MARGTKVGNGQANVDFDVVSANGKGYGVYIAKSKDGRFKRYDQVIWLRRGQLLSPLPRRNTPAETTTGTKTVGENSAV